MVARLAVATLLIAALTASTPAGAKAPKRYSVDISIKLDMTPRGVAERGVLVYKGELRSRKGACEKGRAVTLWRRIEGSDTKEEVGTQKTGGDGKYAIESFNNQDGEYWTTTPKTTFGGGNVCKTGRSETLVRDEFS